VRSPGFGPGFLPWQGNVLDQTSAVSTETMPQGTTWLDYDRTVNQLIDKTLKYLKDKGDCDKTLFVAKKKLTQIRKHADLHDPEGVKEYIQNAKLERGDNEGKPLSNPSKKKLADTYDNLVKANKMTWTKPKFKILENVPPIPTTDAVTRIISHCRSDYKTIFNIIKETGASPEELHSTPRNKICLETGQITIIGHKKHGSGNYKLTKPTLEMLREYLARHQDEEEYKEYPFPRAQNMTHQWIRAKNAVAKQEKQPELRNLPLRSLRNYSGAELYKKTVANGHGDVIEVMRHLRHKKIETTMHYIRAICLDTYDDEFIVKTARTPEECAGLIEAGFIKADEIDGVHLYKKRK
jgi:integrase